MKKIFLFFTFSIFCLTAFSQEVSKDDIKDLVWNKWDTKNFIVLSLDYNEGVVLKNNIENIKNSIFEKWNLRNINFNFECKIICVNNKEMLNKLFKIKESRIEVIKDKNNKIVSSVLWFCEQDDFPKEKLAEICLECLEQDVNQKLPLYMKKGICVLSQNLDKIKDNLNNENILNVDVNKLFKTSDENYNKLNEQEKLKFINQSSCVVLMFRKEYGKNNLNKFINKNEINVFGIKNNDDLNKILNKYNKYLLEDLKNNKVPNDYLEIN